MLASTYLCTPLSSALQLAPAGAAAGATLANTAEQAAAAAAAAASQVAQDLPHLAEQMVEGHLKPAAGVLADNLPGIAQQLAEQPLKEQGRWWVVFYVRYVPVPPAIAVLFGIVRAVQLLVVEGIWSVVGRTDGGGSPEACCWCDR
jgi:hypothetical protein